MNLPLSWLGIDIDEAGEWLGQASETVGALAKDTVDTLGNALKWGEEQLYPSRVVLESFRRSIQLDGYSCGAQCAFMILRYFGKARSIANVIREAGTTLEGTNQTQLRKLLEKRGLKVRRMKSPTIAQIRQAIRRGNPVLVSSEDDDHWIVVYGYADGTIFVADPSPLLSVGCAHSTRQFLARWDRWAMEITDPKG